MQSISDINIYHTLYGHSPRYKWDIMWKGEDNGTYYTKKYFYKQLSWFTHHNDRYTVVATMNLELKAIIQVYLNSK